MKLLKIENNEGYCLDDNEEYIKIDQISKEDILRLMKFIYNNDSIEFDEQKDSGANKINMPSQSIIYEKLHEKLKDLNDKKGEIISQVNAEFESAYKKHKN